MPQSVTELVARLKYSVEQAVGEQEVTGEIGSCKAAASGHIYFTLKDVRSQLQCVLYRHAAASLRMRLREGMQVELYGRATVWEGRGSLQFVVTRAKEAGQGSLQQQFEALKKKLSDEGLFSPARKKPLPRWPRSVALITSPTGAVIEDMRHRLASRAPWMHAYLYPVQVQGKGAEYGLAEAVRQWSDPTRYGLPEVDYIILARGGGSLEDLWCFNEEVLARAIADCPTPLISAVGHETDFTIADFVADLRAPTPTAAIELSTPDAASFREWLEQSERTMKRRLRQALELAQLRMRHIMQSKLARPQEALAGYAQLLDELGEDFQASYRDRLARHAHQLELLSSRISPRETQLRIQSMQHRLEQGAERLLTKLRHRYTESQSYLNKLDAQLRATSPQNALDRGFALVTAADGSLMRDAKNATTGERITVTLKRGALSAEVTGEAARLLRESGN